MPFYLYLHLAALFHLDGFNSFSVVNVVSENQVIGKQIVKIPVFSNVVQME